MKDLQASPDDENVLNLLKKIKSLCQLPENDLKSFIKTGKFKEYEANEIIIAEGHLDSWIYFLLSGSLRITRKGNIVGGLKRLGDTFGEMDALGGTSRTSSVIAETKSIIMAIDTSVVAKEIKGDNVYFCYIIYRIFAEVLAVRLREEIQHNSKISGELNRFKLTSRPPLIAGDKNPPKPAAQPEVSTKNEIDLKDKNLIIVDPNDTTRKILRLMLEQNLQVKNIYEAKSGHNALVMLMERKIDVIITEHEMPKMSGLGLLEKIRKLENIKDIPLILIISEQDAKDTGQFAKDGVNGFIVKPYTVNTVIEKILAVF